MDVREQLVDRKALSLKGLCYVGDDGLDVPVLESCELVLDGNASLLFETASDWTLRVKQGRWPDLTEWYGPPVAWKFMDVEVPVGGAGWEYIVDVADLINEVGEVCGISIYFAAGTLLLRSGAAMSFEIDFA